MHLKLSAANLLLMIIIVQNFGYSGYEQYYKEKSACLIGC